MRVRGRMIGEVGLRVRVRCRRGLGIWCGGPWNDEVNEADTEVGNINEECLIERMLNEDEPRWR